MKKIQLVVLLTLLSRFNSAVAVEKDLNQLMTVNLNANVVEKILRVSWQVWNSHLDQQTWLQVYNFNKRLSRNPDEKFDNTKEGKAFIKLLRDYSEKRLRFARKELEVEAAFELNPGNKNDFFNKEVYHHQKLKEKLTLSQMFSLLKHGEGEAAEHFANIIADLVVAKSENEVLYHPNRWAIATPAGHLGEPNEAKKASFVLSTKIASILDLDIIPMHLQFTQQFYYCNVEDALTRFDMALNQYAPINTQKKNVIIIDDAIVSGATIWGIKAAFNEQIAVSTYGVVNVIGEKFSIEEALNDASTVDNRTVELVLGDADSMITNRTLKTFLKYPKEKIKRILEKLSDARLRNLSLTVQDSPRIVKAAGISAEEIALMNAYIRERGVKLSENVFL